MNRFISSLKRKAAKDIKKIVLPEGDSRRILKAAETICAEGFAKVILVGKPHVIVEHSAEFQIDLDGIEIIDPETYPMVDKFVEYYVKRRTEHHHPVGAEEARQTITQNPVCFGACLVAFGIADGMVAGATHTAKDVIGTALRVIGTRPGVSTVSSSFILLTNTPQFGDDGVFVVGDCGVVIDPTAEQLVDITLNCVERARRTAQILDPKVAFLSYSSKGSGDGAPVEKIREAMGLLRDRNVDFDYDGELQADAALVPAVARFKAPGSPVAGQANILIFPDLGAANICYKMMQFLAGAVVLGPLLQGLAKPVMNLTRGATVDEIVDIVAVCANDASFMEEEKKRDIAFTSRFEKLDRRIALDYTNPAVVIDTDKCRNCTLCRRRCANVMSITDYYSLESTGDKPICVHCGQCSVTCMFGATTTVSHVDEIKKAIADPEKIVVFQTAPAVRVSLGEEFGMEPGAIVVGKMVEALRRLGADYVFDTDFGADMTIMEEATELQARLHSQQKLLPQFTSCCPSWVEFAEIFFPEILPHLSTAKSPISMLSAAIKTYFVKKQKLDPEKVVTICVTPCTSKKAEIMRPELNSAGIYWKKPQIRDTDYCITTRELGNWLKEKNIDFESLPDSSFDSLFGTASGGGMIFGNSGGLMESALRTLTYLETGKEADEEFLHFEAVRGLEGVKEATVSINNSVLHVAAINGLANMRKFLERLEERHAWKKYAFIEVMACPGGCIGGGGQPRVKLAKEIPVKRARIASLYQLDSENPVHASWQNKNIQTLYKEFFGHPLSVTAEELLHTHYINKHYMLGRADTISPQSQK